MADPLDITFPLLASSANVHAVDVLIRGLDVDSEAVRDAAVKSLLKRNSTRGHVEIIRRIPSISPDTRAAIVAQPGTIGSALKQCLGHGDSELRRNALDLVCTSDNYDQVPTLLEMLADERNELHELTAQTLRDLVQRLYEHLNFGRDSKSTGRYLRNAPQIRHKVLTALDHACSHFSELQHPEDVVESILVLGDADNFAVKKVLTQAAPECRELAAELLNISRHPGAMKLVFDFLSKNYPQRAAFDAVQNRDDPEFVCQLLREFPKRLTEQQQKNLRQITSIAWLDPDNLSLEMVPPDLQEALVAFVMATGLPEKQKLDVEEWLVRHGSSQGRVAAASVLVAMDESSVTGIVFDGLNSEDEEVQAWATGQLRTQGIPEAVKLLVERLDSNLPAVREAARHELGSFNLEFLLNLYPLLNPTVCRRAGQLIKRIEPDCLEKLTHELEHPVRRRRIRAARAAEALGLHAEVLPAVITMTLDEDSMVRRTAAEILATVPTRQSIGVLKRLIADPSPRVREAAETSLQQISQSESEADSARSGPLEKHTAPLD